MLKPVAGTAEVKKKPRENGGGRKKKAAELRTVPNQEPSQARNRTGIRATA
jgi:hypothetical protein